MISQSPPSPPPPRRQCPSTIRTSCLPQDPWVSVLPRAESPRAPWYLKPPIPPPPPLPLHHHQLPKVPSIVNSRLKKNGVGAKSISGGGPLVDLHVLVRIRGSFSKYPKPTDLPWSLGEQLAGWAQEFVAHRYRQVAKRGRQGTWQENTNTTEQERKKPGIDPWYALAAGVLAPRAVFAVLFCCKRWRSRPITPVQRTVWSKKEYAVETWMSLSMSINFSI